MVAAPGAFARPTELDAFTQSLRGTNGYRISVYATRQLHSHRRGEVSISASKGRVASSYTARGKVTHRRIRAGLGQFGRVDLRFRPHRRHKRAPLNERPNARQKSQVCLVSLTGPSGRFKGAIRFRGDGGYSSLKAHKEKGVVGTGKASCSSEDDEPPGTTVLKASSGSLRFEALEFRGHAAPLFYAAETERLDSVRIDRYAFETGKNGDFAFDSGLTSAQAAPPKPPFHGAASFTSPDQWTGTLSVSFAGVSDVALTGAGFTASLKRF
ncbi:MAG: hypothetical protein ACRDLL_02655 [Solirubrobacterales bacterium]